MADLVDFSSFNKDEEVKFVPFERAMRENEKRANTIGFGLAGAVFLLASLIVLLLYSPCNKFCDHAPSVCTSDAEKAAFKSACDNSCRETRRGSDYAIQTEVKDEKDEKGQKMKVINLTVDGEEFVDKLNSCAFSGGAGTTCESIAKIAVPKGLWCAKK